MELCEERAKKLMEDWKDDRVKTPFQQLQEMFTLPGGLGQKLIAFWLKSMYELIRNTGVEPGKEFRVSYSILVLIGAMHDEVKERHKDCTITCSVSKGST